MAVLSGCHVVQSYVGKKDTAQIMNGIAWSETIASGSATTQAAASKGPSQPMFHIIAAVNGWVAIGASPDSTTNPRFFILANTPLDVFAVGGAKVKFTADA